MDAGVGLALVIGITVVVAVGLIAIRVVGGPRTRAQARQRTLWWGVLFVGFGCFLFGSWLSDPTSDGFLRLTGMLAAVFISLNGIFTLHRLLAEDRRRDMDRELERSRMTFTSQLNEDATRNG